MLKETGKGRQRPEAEKSSFCKYIKKLVCSRDKGVAMTTTSPLCVRVRVCCAHEPELRGCVFSHVFKLPHIQFSIMAPFTPGRKQPGGDTVETALWCRPRIKWVYKLQRAAESFGATRWRKDCVCWQQKYAKSAPSVKDEAKTSSESRTEPQFRVPAHKPGVSCQSCIKSPSGKALRKRRWPPRQLVTPIWYYHTWGISHQNLINGSSY